MSRDAVSKQPVHGDAKCMSCMHLSRMKDSDESYIQKHYGICNFPLPKIPAAMILNGVRDSSVNRYIPQLELFGYQNNKHLSYCGAYSPGKNNFSLNFDQKKDVDQKKDAALSDLSPMLIDLMKPFKVERGHVVS